MERNFPIMEFEAQEEGEDQFYCHVTANLYAIDEIQVKKSENATITINGEGEIIVVRPLSSRYYSLIPIFLVFHSFLFLNS